MSSSRDKTKDSPPTVSYQSPPAATSGRPGSRNQWASQKRASFKPMESLIERLPPMSLCRAPRERPTVPELSKGSVHGREESYQISQSEISSPGASTGGTRSRIRIQSAGFVKPTGFVGRSIPSPAVKVSDGREDLPIGDNDFLLPQDILDRVPQDYETRLRKLKKNLVEDLYRQVNRKP